jgi:hypothetical protein
VKFYKYLICVALLFCSKFIWAQNSLSFYSLGNATFQNGNFNPAYVPDGKLFIGLPVLSGVHFNYNNRLSYDEAVSTNNETGNPKIDLRKALTHMRQNNMMSTQVNVSLLHVGFRTNKGLTYSIFANERIEADVLYDKDFMNFAIKGNSTVIDQKIQAGKTRISATHFREIGVGFTIPSPHQTVILGGRLKYLQGFVNYSTPENQKATISTNGETYIIETEMKNAMLRSSGVDIVTGKSGDFSHFIFNQNRGVALDLGFSWKMDDYSQISFAINDLGFISWKENIENKYLVDNQFTYGGVDLKETTNIEQTIKDSLLNNFKAKTNYDNYRTLVGPRIYADWAYTIPGGFGEVVTSFGTRYVQAKMKAMAGVGYRVSLGHYLVASANVTKLPQQFFNVGAGLAVKGGPIQYYLAVDQIYNFDATKFQSFDVRTGVNFVFGDRPARQNKTRHGSTTTVSTEKLKKTGPGYAQKQSFMGQKVKIKGHDGIYSIIPLQRRRAKEEYMMPAPVE